MKRNDLSIWAILIAASIVGSIVAAALPDREPKASDKHVKHAAETASDEIYTWVTTRSETAHNALSTQRLDAPKSL